MLQFSVYARITRNHDDAQTYLKKLKLYLPPKGSVRAMLVTEKQYANMFILVGHKTATEVRLADREILLL